MPLRSYVGFFANQMEQEAQTFHNLADGMAPVGTLIQNSSVERSGTSVVDSARNWSLCRKWILAAGLGFEQSHVECANDQLYQRSGPATPSADRTFYNWAPEMSLTLEAG